LFEAAGKRLATLLTNLLLSRDLQENKARLEEAQRVAHVAIGIGILRQVRSSGLTNLPHLWVQTARTAHDTATVSGLVHPDDREALYREVDVKLLPACTRP